MNGSTGLSSQWFPIIHVKDGGEGCGGVGRAIPSGRATGPADLSPASGSSRSSVPIAPFTPHEIDAIVAMWEIHARHKGAACEPVGNWLVEQMKRTWPRYAWFRGPSKTNSKRTWTVASYHHPAQLCWLWSIWFTAIPTDGKWGLRWGGYRGNFWFAVKYLFRVSIHRQPRYSWMLSGNAKRRLCAIVEAKLGEAA